MAPQDTSTPSPTVPRGSVRVRVIDPDFHPVAGTPVKLGIIYRSVAEGESRSAKMGSTGEDGLAAFDGLSIASDYAYRVTVPYQGAQYMAEPFTLQSDMGEQVTVHVYPVTTDIDKASIGLQGFIYIETREDVFQFEVLYRVYNIGKVTWVPTDLVTPLPKGWKAFNAQQDMGANGVTKDDAGARWMGTFSPGQHDVSYRYQIPNEDDEDVSFTIPLPPRVGEIQVVAEAAQGMSLSATGFSPAERTKNNNGQSVLAVGRQMRNRERVNDVVVELKGIPVPGPGRWLAVMLAGLFAAVGMSSALSNRKPDRALKSTDEDREQARDLLLKELLELERAHRDQSIGPRAYAQARDALVAALVRIGGWSDAPSGKRGQKRSSKASSKSNPRRRSGAVAN